MPSQILITGATGFIGRRLTRDLVMQGERVRILARNEAKARALFGDDVEVEVGDMGDADSLDRACRGIETIYNIAGIYRFGFRHRRELWSVNVEGADHLFRTAMEAGVGKVVHLSSGGVLRKQSARGGVDSTTTLLDENDFPAEPPRFCYYKASKWHAEKRALAWARQGLPVTIASTTCPIGGGDETPTPTGQIIRDFLARRFPFYCRTGLNFIGIGDLSRGLQLAAESGGTGRRYLLSGENLWLKEFLDLLSLETGLPAPRMALPNVLIRVIGCGGEVASFVGPRDMSVRVCLESALQAEHLQFFDNSRTRHELGWKKFSTIGENISEAVAWFRNEAGMEHAPVAPPSMESHVR